MGYLSMIYKSGFLRIKEGFLNVSAQQLLADSLRMYDGFLNISKQHEYLRLKITFTNIFL